MHILMFFGPLSAKSVNTAEHPRNTAVVKFLTVSYRPPAKDTKAGLAPRVILV